MKNKKYDCPKCNAELYEGKVKRVSNLEYHGGEIEKLDTIKYICNACYGWFDKNLKEVKPKVKYPFKCSDHVYITCAPNEIFSTDGEKVDSCKADKNKIIKCSFCNNSACMVDCLWPYSHKFVFCYACMKKMGYR